MSKTRLDHLLVERGLAESGEQARRYILAGLVQVEGVQRPKPGLQVRTDVVVQVSQPEHYVSRGAYKLLRALEVFPVLVQDRVAMDLGASTGGFSQVLLEKGSKWVIAVDVGRSQLHQSLRGHDRLQILENVNARFLTADQLGSLKPELVTADLSFISVTKVLPAVAPLVAQDADFIILVKPQFEATRSEVSKARGIIKDPAVWQRALESVGECALSCGLSLWDACRSPITGGSGNVEFLLHLRKEDAPKNGLSHSWEELVLRD